MFNYNAETNSSIIHEFDDEIIFNKGSLRKTLTLYPYWQIMENSSKNFSEILIFQVVTQAVLLENSSIKNHEYLFNSGASHRPLLENSSIRIFN